MGESDADGRLIFGSTPTGFCFKRQCDVDRFCVIIIRYNRLTFAILCSCVIVNVNQSERVTHTRVTLFFAWVL